MEMATIIAGMKRQLNDDNRIVSSDVKEIPADYADFFDDN